MAQGAFRIGLAGWIPNALTTLRLVAGLIFPWAPASRRLELFAVAAVTEALDGPLSRLWNTTSRTGQILDPIADKIFVLGAYAALVGDGLVPLPAAIGLVTRDLLVLLGAVWVVLRYGREGMRRMPPRVLGKVTTAIQLGLMFLFLWRPETRVSPWVFGAAAGVSLAAGIDYLRHFR